MSAKSLINEVERNTILDGEIFKYSKINYKIIGQKISAEYEKDKTVLHKKSS